MRDPGRIDRVLNELKQLWLTMPDMRFFQMTSLIEDGIKGTDPYYVEDDVVLEVIRDSYPMLEMGVPEEFNVDFPVTVYFDGGARGNGKSDCLSGWAFVDPVTGVWRGEATVGKTNNEMEYMGLLMAIKWARACKYTNVTFLGDSELVVNQIKGKWKLKAENLKEINAQCVELLADFKHWEIKWVPREENVADAVYNQALDAEAAKA